MGIYISALNCKKLYDIDINCEIQVTGNETYPNQTIIGGLLQGQIPPDPDIAGIGVVSSFIGATAFALSLSICSLISLYINRRYLICLDKLHVSLRLAQRLRKFRVHELCEELVLGISDTQVFTGAAYAVALRYFKGCTTTAYHYDVVAMMMLLTCTTHLMSVTIVKNYWKYRTLSALRIVTCSGVFIVTGLPLANQNWNGYDDERRFPAEIPSENATYSPVLLPAACFQKGNSQLLGTLHHSVSDKANDAFFKSQPGNNVPGWDCYLVTLLLYILAAFVDILRAFRRGAQSNPTGKRARFVNLLHLSSMAQRQSRQQQHRRKKPKRGKPKSEQKQPSNCWPSPGTILFCMFCLYLLSGIGVGIWTVYVAAHQIGGLRGWVKGSHWLKNQSCEDDSASFGQLVPIFLNLMLLFTLVHVITEFYSKNKDRKYDIYGGIIHDEPEGDERPNGTAMQEVDQNNVGYKPDSAVQVHAYDGGPPHSGSPTPVGAAPNVWNNFNTASQPTTPGPGIMTTTPTSAQIIQFPSTAAISPTSQSQPQPQPSHSSMTNLRQSSANSVPTSPQFYQHSPYQQQSQQQRSMSMTSPPQSQTYFQPTHPTASSPVMFQPPQYAQTHSASPPPQWNQNQGQSQGQGHYQVY